MELKRTKYGLPFSNGGEFRPASGLKLDAGPRRQRFVKDLIRVGNYVHPNGDYDLDVTTGRMDRWIAAFKAMQRSGVDVEVVIDHSFSAKDVVGKVIDLYREGDTLYGVHELVGDGIDLAHRVKNVSVWIEPDHRDGLGNSYGEAIVHSAIVQQPVVPWQTSFVPVDDEARPIAASMLARVGDGLDDITRRCIAAANLGYVETR